MACSAPGLSQRARDDAAPLISYYDQLLQAWADAFHPTDNPSGFKIMAVAENKLMWPMLKERLGRQQPLDAATGYTSSAGCDAIRSALASFMSRDIFSDTTVDPAHVVVSGGVGAVRSSFVHLSIASASSCPSTPCPLRFSTTSSSPSPTPATPSSCLRRTRPPPSRSMFL